MFRPLLAMSLCLIVMAGCGETRHPVRQETMAPSIPEAEASESADRTEPLAGSGQKTNASPWTSSHVAMQDNLPVVPPTRAESTVTAPQAWKVVQPRSSMIQAEYALPRWATMKMMGG